jgi:hypothetical protein
MKYYCQSWRQTQQRRRTAFFMSGSNGQWEPEQAPDHAESGKHCFGRPRPGKPVGVGPLPDERDDGLEEIEPDTDRLSGNAE